MYYIIINNHINLLIIIKITQFVIDCYFQLNILNSVELNNSKEWKWLFYSSHKLQRNSIQFHLDYPDLLLIIISLSKY